MKNFFRNIILLFAIVAIVFVFRHSIQQSLFSLRDKLFPCIFPIQYSIGSFDEEFGISKDKFLDYITLSEKTWEDSINRQLFIYVPDGNLKINLIYDDRQETTEKLSNLDFKIESDRKIYESLVSEYEILKRDYLNEKELIEAGITLFQSRQRKYETDVDYWNSRGGAPKKDFERLTNEATYLKNEAEKLNDAQYNLNLKTNKINDLVNQINAFASNLNLKTKQYNTIGGELGEEFEEGLYIADESGQKINIYQFEDENNLTRLLIHEMGHALSLGHSENPSAIMYRLNVGGDMSLSQDDIDALKKHCRINVSSAGIEPAITP